MPKIPVYEKQLAPQAPGIQTPRLSAPPASAFSTSLNEAGARLGQVVAGIGDKLAAHAIEWKKREQEKVVIGMDTEFRKAMDAELFNSEAGEDGRPKGILSRRLGHAAGATMDFDGRYAKLREKFVSRDLSDFERESISQIMDRHYAATRDSVIRHEAVQGEEDFRATAEAGLKQYEASAAGSPTPELFVNYVASASKLQDSAAARMGWSPEQISVAKKNLVGNMALGYIKTNLEENPARARQALAEVRNAIPADVYEDLDGQVLNSEFVTKVTKAKLAGEGLDTVLTKYAGDKYYTKGSEVREAALVAAARKVYAVTDPYLYRELFRKVEDGTAKESELDAAMNSGRLEQGDWESLWKAMASGRAGNKIPAAIKLKLDDLELKAKETWGNAATGKGGKKVDEFMYVMSQEALKGGDPAVFYKKGLDMMKDVVVEKGSFFKPGPFRDNVQPLYKYTLEHRRAMDLQKAAQIEDAIGVLQKMGQPVVDENIDYLLALWEKNPNDKRFNPAE